MPTGEGPYGARCTRRHGTMRGAALDPGRPQRRTRATARSPVGVARGRHAERHPRVVQTDLCSSGYPVRVGTASGPRIHLAVNFSANFYRGIGRIVHRFAETLLFRLEPGRWQTLKESLPEAKNQLIVMQVKVLGAARQVGRSGFMVTHGETSVLLDYGALATKEPGFPMHVQPKSVDRAASQPCPPGPLRRGPRILPRRRQGQDARDPVTSELSSLLIEDFIRISGPYLPFEFLDLMAIDQEHDKPRLQGDVPDKKDISVTYYDRGRSRIVH